MARRPTRLPRWGYGAAGGDILEPPEGEAAAGWPTGRRPAAQYFNWLLNTLGAWTAWLAGPSVSVWSRRELPDASTDAARVAYDSTTADSIETRYHYALAGSDGTGPFVAVSRTGADWVTRRNIAGTPGNPQGIYIPAIASEAFWLWTSSPGKTYYGLPDTVANAATNPLRNAGEDWVEVALDDGAAYPVGFAEGASAGAICSTDTGIEYRANGSYAAWTTHPSLPGARQEGRACCWTGTAFLDISSDAGDLCVSRATTASGTWTVVATVTGLSAPTSWRLALGATPSAPAVIAAWKVGTLSDVDLHVSADDGLSWTPITLPASMTGVCGLAYHDGTWVAAGVDAPHAWSSTDLETWTPLSIPAGDTITQLRDVVYGPHGWLLASREGCLQGAPATDATPGAWTLDAVPLALGNAGWLRSVRISVTPPADGEVLVYDAGADEYVPTAPAAAPVLPWTRAAAPAAMQTTDATVTTLATLATTTDRGHLLRVEVLAVKGDRSAAVGWSYLVTVTNAAGTVTVRDTLGACTDPASTLVDATSPVAFDVSGTSVRVRVKGTAATTIDWSATATTLLGGT